MPLGSQPLGLWVTFGKFYESVKDFVEFVIHCAAFEIESLFIFVCSPICQTFKSKDKQFFLELVSKELNHLAAILHVYAGV